MSNDPFHMNRPVHLARRDVFFEKAVTLINQLALQKDPREQQQSANQALRFLQVSRRHGAAANQSDKTSANSRLFVSFIDTAIDNTQSITRMLRRRLAVEAEDSLLQRFLGEEASGSKMSAHYRRCAAHILKGLLLILEHADGPYEELKQASLAKMNPVDKARYEKARSHFEEEVERSANR